MALSEAPAWNVLTLKTTVNHSRTIDLSNRAVLHTSLPASPALMSSVQVYSAALWSTSGFKWRRWCFQEDFRQEELEGAREVSGLTFSSAPTSCTSPSSCSLSLWIQGRGGSREGGWEEGFGWWWGSLDGWGHALGRTGPGNFRCMFQLFSGWEGFGVGVGVWVQGGSGWFGVWGLGSQPATAGSLLVSHGQKKQSWTLPGYLSAALQSSPKKTGTQKWGLHGWWHILTATYSQLHSTFRFPYFMLTK